MLAEIVCAVAFLMTLRHVLALLEQNAELAGQVLFLTYKLDRLRELSIKLRYHLSMRTVTTDAWRMLGRRRPSARMRVAVHYRRKSDVACVSASIAGEGAGPSGDSRTDAMSGEIAANMSCMSSGGIMHSERRLSPCFDASARIGVCGSTSDCCTLSDSSSGRDSNFSARRCHKHGERSCSESGSSSG